MSNVQGLIFQAASQWEDSTGLIVLGLGLLYLLQGFRFARFLVPLTCGAGGFLAGRLVCELANLPPIVALAAAVVAGGVAAMRYRNGLAFASGLVFGMLALYLTQQLGYAGDAPPLLGLAGFVLGIALIWVCPRILPIVVTMTAGAGLTIVAFVAVTSSLAPSLGLTFQDWAASYGLLVPGFILMLCTLGYSVQANARQGDMETGGDASLRDLEAV